MTATRQDDIRDSVSAKRFVSELIAQWPSTVPFDARHVLQEHTDLRDNRSAVLDLAYEEFCRRTQAGESLSADEFARQFPAVERSLLHVLAVHRYLDENSSWRNEFTPEPWPSIGEEFLGFELQEELGRGAFSRVYLAREPSLGDRTVVVKVCRRGGEEARLLGQLEHPNIVPVHSVRQDSESGLWAICMPYLSRATLFDVLDAIAARGAVPADGRFIADAVSGDRTAIPTSYVDVVVQLGTQLAEALQFTHSRGICHGDIKPSNVLITPAGRAMLLDFNLSFGAEQAGPREIGGTLPYMAPEQLRAVLGEPDGGRPDARTDLFSLGVLLYELLAGRLPFGPLSPDRSRNEVAADLLKRQQHGPHSLRDVNPRVGRQLAQLIESCLAFGPDERPPSAASLAAALQAQLAGRHWVWRSLRRPWAASLLACSLGLSLGAALTISARDLPKEVAVTAPDQRTLLVHAQTAFQGQEFPAAVALLDRILAINPEDVEARFLRARAFLKIAEYRSAADDFQLLAERTSDGRLTAALAYCQAREKRHVEAIALHKRAIEQGFALAAVLNNMGHCCLMRGDLDEAEIWLAAATKSDPALLAAHHNLALTYFRRAARSREASSVRHAREAFELIEQAAHLGSESTELFQNWAYISALLSQRTFRESPNDSDRYAHRALELSHQAIAAGLDPAKLGPVLQYLSHSPEVRDKVEALSKAPSTGLPSPTVLLIDPLADLPVQFEPPLGSPAMLPSE